VCTAVPSNCSLRSAHLTAANCHTSVCACQCGTCVRVQHMCVRRCVRALRLHTAGELGDLTPGHGYFLAFAWDV
jgi:hypothetical protein